jgi:hypothetical protein
VRRAHLLCCLVVSACIHLPAAQAPRSQAPNALAVNGSTPTDGDADVRLDVVVRIRFSKEVDPRTFADRVRVSYSAAESADRGEAQPPAVAFSTRYIAASRTLEIIPSQRLERFRQVAVELLPGIVDRDGTALTPWALRFRTGGS